MLLSNLGTNLITGGGVSGGAGDEAKFNFEQVVGF